MSLNISKLINSFNELHSNILFADFHKKFKNLNFLFNFKILVEAF